MSAPRPRAPRASARPALQAPLPPAAGSQNAPLPLGAANPNADSKSGAIPPEPQGDLAADGQLDIKDNGYDGYDDYRDEAQLPQGMPYPPNGGSNGTGTVSQLGPFANPLANKVVRGVSALTTLIVIILQFLLLSQGVGSYMKAASAKTGNSSSTEDREATSTASSKKKDKTSKDSKDELLGRALSTIYKRAIPTARILKRNLTKRAESSSPTPTPSALSYVPGSDVPDRDGAVGFTATGHLFAVIICMLLLYMDWLLLRQSPTITGYWTPLVIATVQLYICLDILGRVISKAGEGGSYLLLLLSILNTFLAGWTVLQARRNGSPDIVPYDDYPDEGTPGPAPPLETDGIEGDDDPEAGQQQIDPKTGLSITQNLAAEKEGRPRGSSASFITDDIDSYYQRSPSTYKGPGQPMPRRYSQASSLAVPQPAYYGGQATTPIDLYGPQEYQRRLEQHRRSRRQSLTQPTLQYDPVQGRYVQPANTFGQRTFDTVPEEDEEEEQIVPQPPPTNDPRISRDGFANRAREWKRLQRM